MTASHISLPSAAPKPNQLLTQTHSHSHTHSQICLLIPSLFIPCSPHFTVSLGLLHIHINTSHSPFSSAFSQSRWLRCPHTHSPTHLLWSLHPVLPLPSRNRTPLKKHTSAARLCHSHYHSNIYIATARLTPQSEKKKTHNLHLGTRPDAVSEMSAAQFLQFVCGFVMGFFLHTVTFTGHSSPHFCANHLRSYNQNTYIHVLAVLSYNYSCQCSLHSAIAAHVTETT